MHVRCPHCRNAIEIVGGEEFADVVCPSCGSSFNLAPETESFTPAARTIGHFQLLELLGGGGFGTVYKAQDTELDRLVALKIPRRDQVEPENVEMFLREARAAAQLRHPGIVAVHEVGREDGTLYIVSDYIRGATLADRLTIGPLAPREAAELLAQAADALHHAHDAGVIHRDLKPSNIMLDGEGRPHIMDFGLAKREAGEITMTVEGKVLGTAAYMSPEQARGEAHSVDRRTDVYSLGVILFQLLTGELPFRGNRAMLLNQVLYDEPTSPRKLNRSISRDFETITLKCLAKEPARRYGSAADLAGDLRRFLNGQPILARPVGRMERAVRWVRRNKTVSALVAGVAATLLLGAVVSAVFAVRASHNATESQKNETRAVNERKRADDQTKIAQGNERLAKQRERDARWSAYVPDMNLAFQAYEAGHIGRANELLEKQIPPADQPDLRGTEWYLLWSLTHQDEATLYGHKGPVNSVAWSPDGKIIASVGDDGELILWDAKSHALQRQVRAHAGKAKSVAFLPDGALLCTAGTDAKINVWDGHSLQLKRSLPIPPPTKIRLEFSPDGKYLVAAGYSRQGLMVWETATWREWCVPSASPFDTLALSPDSQMIAASDPGARLWFWDLNSGRELELASHDFFFCLSLGFAPDGKSLLYGARNSDGTRGIGAVDLVSGAQVQRVSRAPYSNPHALAYAPNREIAATGCGDIHNDSTGMGLLDIWDLSVNRWITSLGGHDGTVFSAGFAPDGTKLVTGGADGTVRIWSEESFRLEERSVGHTQLVLAAALSPDGAMIATGSIDKTVKLWDRQSGRLVRNLPHGGRVFGTVFSPDGRQLATTSVDETESLRIWDIDTQTARVVPITVSPAVSVDFSSDGRLLAVGTGSGSGYVQIVETETGRLLAKFRPHRDTIYSLKFTRDGKHLVTGAQDGTACLIDVEMQEVVHRFTGHTQPIRAVALSPDEALLATASLDGTARVWNLKSGEHRATCTLSPRPPQLLAYGVAFCQGGSKLAVGFWEAKNGSVALYDVRKAFAAVSNQSTDSKIGALAASREKDWLVTGHENGQSLVWDGNPLTERLQLGDLADCWSVAFAPDGKTVAVGGHRIVRLYDAATRRERQRLTGHEHEVYGVAFSPDGKWLASVDTYLVGGGGGSTRVWDAHNGTLVTTLPMDGTRVQFSPDGKWLAVGMGWCQSGCEEQVGTWETATWKQRSFARFPNPGGVGALRFVAGPRILAVGNRSYFDSVPGAIALWDFEAGKLRTVLKEHHSSVTDLLVIADGQKLVSSGTDRTLRVWDLNSATMERTLSIRSEPWALVRLSEDRVAAGCEDGTIRIWETKTSQEVASWKAHDSGVSSLALSPDGRLLVSVSSGHSQETGGPLFSKQEEGGNVRFWRIASPDEVDQRLVAARGAGWKHAAQQSVADPVFARQQTKLNETLASNRIDQPTYYLACQLLRADNAKLAAADQDRRALVRKACDGSLAFEDLPKRLDEVEPQEARDRRLAEEQTKAANQERSSLIAELLAEAKANDSTEHGRQALAALEHVLRLEHEHAEAKALRAKIEAYYPLQTQTNSLGIKLVEVRPARFWMGSPFGENGREVAENLHPVRLTNTMFMAAHEVTRGQFAMFVGKTGYATDAEKSPKSDKEPALTWRSPGFEQADSHPVVCVSWNDAVAFCDWLSKEERRNYRLPTEAEWEYACRAGTITAYFWGDKPDEATAWANVADEASKESIGATEVFSGSDMAKYTSPIGAYKPNAWGFLDMVGNVREWCSDRYGSYPVLISDDPHGPDIGQFRVVRGGSWRSPPRTCRSAARDKLPVESSAADVGFRIVLVAN